MRRRSGGGPRTGSLHWPGSSWLHRVPVGVKLGVLAAVGTGLAIVGRWQVSVAVVVGAVVAILAARVPIGVAWRQARPFLILIAIVLMVQVAIGRGEEGLVAAARILGVAMAAVAVTLTTSFGEIVDWLERVLLRLRVPPDRVFRISVATGLALRSIEHLGVSAQRVLDARRARGLHRSARAFAVPMVVAAARFAHDAGEALEARGIAGTVRRSDV